MDLKKQLRWQTLLECFIHRRSINRLNWMNQPPTSRIIRCRLAKKYWWNMTSKRLQLHTLLRELDGKILSVIKIWTSPLRLCQFKLIPTNKDHCFIQVWQGSHWRDITQTLTEVVFLYQLLWCRTKIHLRSWLVTDHLIRRTILRLETNWNMLSMILESHVRTQELTLEEHRGHTRNKMYDKTR